MSINGLEDVYLLNELSRVVWRTATSDDTKSIDTCKKYEHGVGCAPSSIGETNQECRTVRNSSSSVVRLKKRQQNQFYHSLLVPNFSIIKNRETFFG